MNNQEVSVTSSTKVKNVISDMVGKDNIPEYYLRKKGGKPLDYELDMLTLDISIGDQFECTIIRFVLF